MIGPILFLLMLAVAVIIPALMAWSLFLSRPHFQRLLATMAGGQILVMPAIAMIAFSQDRSDDEDPIKTVLIYAGMALVFSIMTFAIREMVKVQRKK